MWFIRLLVMMLYPVLVLFASLRRGMGRGRKPIGGHATPVLLAPALALILPAALGFNERRCPDESLPCGEA